MSLPEWVLPFKEPHTETKCIKGNYYKYEVKSVYDASKKHSVKKTIRLLGKVSEKNGFVPYHPTRWTERNRKARI